MKVKMLVAGGALTLAVSAVCAPTAAAQTAGYTEGPCGDEFRVPWSVDAWTGAHKIVFSPFGTADIYCVSFHGQTSTYQVDTQGRKHLLNPSSGLVGALAPNLYFWDPASY
ncbi:hypothetical protein ACWDTG_26275 [Rhodococcus zopfii]|uniref:hypothetical protein n=1 Tax=Rhodococcus zopfii TaxID=43772 RepID=UPI0011110D35|nr:hypothetical protein [Rhodococcus zopfii]